MHELTACCKSSPAKGLVLHQPRVEKRSLGRQQRDRSRGPAPRAPLSPVTKTAAKQCEGPLDENPQPTAARSSVFTRGIKSCFFFGARQASPAPFRGGTRERRWICAGFVGRAEHTPCSAVGPAAPRRASPLPRRFVLTGFPPPLGQKLSQPFCLPACRTIIYLAGRQRTELGLTSPGASLHLSAASTPRASRAASA